MQDGSTAAVKPDSTNLWDPTHKWLPIGAHGEAVESEMTFSIGRHAIKENGATVRTPVRWD